MKKLKLKRYQANIRNAQRSTGPVTPEGKLRSSQNAINHGLTAQTVLLPGESQARFIELLSGFEADFNPQSSVARFQVEQLAVAAWRIRRGQVFETTLVRDYLSTMDPPSSEEAADARTIITRAWVNSRADLAVRYESTHHRTFRYLYDRLLALECGDPDPIPSGPQNQQDAAENTAARNEANAPAHPPTGDPAANAAPSPNETKAAAPSPCVATPATYEPAPREEAHPQPAPSAQPNQQDTSENQASRNEANHPATPLTGGLAQPRPEHPPVHPAPQVPQPHPLVNHVLASHITGHPETDAHHRRIVALWSTGEPEGLDRR